MEGHIFPNLESCFKEKQTSFLVQKMKGLKNLFDEDFLDIK